MAIPELLSEPELKVVRTKPKLLWMF